MDADFYYDSFFFCSRDDLEGLQLVRKSLRNKIVAGSNSLPLRPIGRVEMVRDAVDGKIKIFVKNDAVKRDYEASVHGGDFAETLSRLQHICVKYFIVGIHDSPFLRYWKTEETAAFTVVNIRFEGTDDKGDKDYGLLDSIVNHVRPRTTQIDFQGSAWRQGGYNSEKLELLRRNSLLNSLKICCLTVWGDAFPAPTFILKEPGYPKYELWCGNCQVADGIDGFIEGFVRDGCANEKLKSVCIQWCDGAPMPKQLCKPTQIDVPLPKVEMLMQSIPGVQRVTQCEMQTFVNKKQWKHMEVRKWTVAHDYGYGRSTTHLLQCRVKNL